MKIPALVKGAKQSLPLVPLKELVVFPHMVIPFFAGNAESIKAVEESLAGNRLIFLVCQKNDAESPGKDDIYQSGTVSKVLQMLKLPDGTIRVLAEGRQRGVIKKYEEKDDMRRVMVHPLEDSRSRDEGLKPLMTTVIQTFEKYAKLQKKVPKESIEAIRKTEMPDKLVDLVCANTSIQSDKKVEVLSIVNTRERLETLAVILEAENEVLTLQNKINLRVKKSWRKTRRNTI